MYVSRSSKPISAVRGCNRWLHLVSLGYAPHGREQSGCRSPPDCLPEAPRSFRWHGFACNGRVRYRARTRQAGGVVSVDLAAGTGLLDAGARQLGYHPMRYLPAITPRDRADAQAETLRSAAISALGRESSHEPRSVAPIRRVPSSRRSPGTRHRRLHRCGARRGHSRCRT